MKYKLCLVLSILALWITINPLTAQEPGEPQLCNEENPQYNGLEQIDDYTYIVENELGQQFILSFSTDSDPEAVQLFVSELNICLEYTTESSLIGEVVVPSATLVDGEETTVIFGIFEENDGITIGSNIPYTSIFMETLADILGMSVDDLDGIVNNFAEDEEITLNSFLEEMGVDPTVLITEAINRVLIDPETVAQYFAEAGFPINPQIFIDEAIQRYSDTLEEPGMPIFPGPADAEFGLLIEIDFAMEEDEAREFNTIYFVIDPSLLYGWSRRHAYCLGTRAWLKANITANEGSLSGYMYQLPTANSRLKIVWSGWASKPNSTNSGRRWADSLQIPGWKTTNKYTLSGTWTRSINAAEDQPDSCMNLG